MSFDSRFPAPGIANNPIFIDDDNVNNATHPLPEDAAAYPDPRQRSVSPTRPRKKQKTIQQPDQPTATPAAMESSTDTDIASTPYATAEDLQAQIIDLFPDICADYVTRLIEPLYNALVPGHDRLLVWDQFLVVKNTVIEQILNQQSYPKRKRKRYPDLVEDKRNADRKKYLNSPKVEDKPYQTRIQNILEQEFPLVPHNTIGRVIKNEKSLYSAYLELYTQEHVLEEVQRPYTRLKHTRTPSLDKELEVIQVYEHRYGTDDVIEELNAAKEATRQETNATREIADKEMAEKLNEEEHVQVGRLVECKCCYSDVPSNRHVTCDGADAHVFCFTCIRKSAETQIGMMKYVLRCMDVSGCDATFTRPELEMVLGSALLYKLDALQQDDEIHQANLTGLETCPFCDFKAIYPPVEEDREFRCLNPSCKIVSCRLCDFESHLPHTCEEARRKVRGLEVRHQVEEAMSKALVRHCPKCNVKIVKESGCNHVVCSKCHCSMCYVCQRNLSIGGQHAQGCRGYDDDRRDVYRAQDTAIKKILKEDPTLKDEDLRVYPSKNDHGYNPPSYVLQDLNRPIAMAPPQYPYNGVNTRFPTQAVQPPAPVNPSRPGFDAAANGLGPAYSAPDMRAPPPPPPTPQTTLHSMQTTPPDLNFARSTPGDTVPEPKTTLIASSPTIVLPFTAAFQGTTGSNPPRAPDAPQGLTPAGPTTAHRGPESPTQTQPWHNAYR